MLDKLTEALNSEIAQGVITSQEEAVDWISGTLLFRRIQAHPLFYGMNGSGLDAARSFIADKSRKSIEELRKIGAIDMKEDGTFSHSATSTVSPMRFFEIRGILMFSSASFLSCRSWAVTSWTYNQWNL